MDRFSRLVYGAGVSAPPHDLLKLVNWKEHNKLKHLPDNLRKNCPELSKTISGHRRWEADYLASALSRLRMEHTYWGRRDLDNDPFLIQVYGDPAFWPREKRNELWKRIRSIYELGESAEAHAKVNYLLSDFPQDSRFPMVSLETHHWLTWVLRKQLQGKFTDMVCIIKISIPETVFHKLKGMREFHDKRRDFIRAVAMRLRCYSPHVIGDELYVVGAFEEIVEQVLEEVENTGLACDAEIFYYNIGKVAVRVGKQLRSYRRVVGFSTPKKLSIGSNVWWRFAPRSAEWVKVLDFPYVAWISIKPNCDLQKSAEEFLKFAEQKLAEMGKEKNRRRKVSNPFLSEIPVCPELLISVAEGYEKFLSKFIEAMGRRVELENLILRSFDRSLFVYGLKKPSQAIDLYLRLNEVKSSLHIEAILSVVVTKPKHPFWHVLSLFGKKDQIVFASGDKLIMLENRDAKLVGEVKPLMGSVNRTTFHNEILMKSRHTGVEYLKLHLEGLAQNRRIPRNVFNKLCWLIDELSKRYKKETERRIVTYRAFEVLEKFTYRRR